MAVGMRVWDAAQNLIQDTTTHTARLLGLVTVTTNNSSGNITVAEFNQGAPFFLVTSFSGGIYLNFDVSISGTTMSWAPHANTNTNTGYSTLAYIYYGVR